MFAMEDPFANHELYKPVDSPLAPPTPPERCARTPPSIRTAQKAAAAATISNLYARSDEAIKSTPGDPDLTFKGSSLSSTEFGSGASPVSPIDLEKAYLAKEDRQHSAQRLSKDDRSQRSHRSSQHKKSSRSPRNSAHHRSPVGNDHVVARSWEDNNDDDEEENDHGRRIQEAHGLRILLFLSGPCVLLSFINMLWAFIALFITALTQPVRICARRPGIAQQIAGLLGPSLNLQLRSIYTPLSPHANEDGSYHSGMLFLTHLLSPFLSLCVMVAAWVLAIYWTTSAVVGDPAGQDRRDDGLEQVLALRRWWERWLMRSVKEV